MRIKPLTPLLAIAVLLGATAARAPDVPPAPATGKPVTCVQINQIRNTRVRDDRTIDFVMYGNKVYRNVLPNSCPELGSERAFSYETSINQLCNVDIITVYRNSSPIMRGASCGLGMFQPVDLPRKYQ